MEGGEGESLVFNSAEIATSKSNSENAKFFVRVTKNPILRWILRARKIEEAEFEDEQPAAPAPPSKNNLKVTTPPKVVQKPRPQFRAFIRVSTAKLVSTSRKTSPVLVFFLLVSLAAAGFFAYEYFLGGK